MAKSKKPKPTDIINLGKFQVQAYGKVADDVDMGIWLTFKVADKRKTKARCMLTEYGARKLGKKLLKAADKVKK
jgi:hypothetical protein